MKKEEKFLLFILFALSCINLKAQTYYQDQKLHLTFTLDETKKEAMVGTGLDLDMANAICYPPIGDDWWNEYTNLWENIIIPETIDYNNETYTVTSIATCAFYECTRVKTITLPKTITTINSNAFYWCVNLTAINIPENLTVIKSNVFNNCRSVTSFEIPQKVTIIGDKAFFDCKGWVGTITIPSSCTSIGTDAFSWCTGITGIVFEDGDSPLSLSYAYSKSVYYEGTDAAKYRGLFADCPIKNAYIGRDLNYPTKNGEVCSPFKSISNYCTGSSSYQGYQGKSFTSIQFGDNVTVIPDEMFWKCGVEKELILPPKLKTIGSEAFYESFSSTYSSGGQVTLTLPSTLESIKKYAFSGCDNLRIIQSEATTPPTLPETSSDDPFTKCDVMVIVPNGTGESYRNHAIWGKKNILDHADELITVNVKTAGSLESRLLAKALQLKDIRRLKLQGTLNEEDWNTVKLMVNLNECDLSELVIEEIPNKVFRGKTSLLEIKLPQSLTAISDSAFYNCTHLLSDIEIPASCQNIGKYAFYNTLINSVTFPYMPICIGNYALGRCYNLQELELYGEGTVINSDAFFYSRRIEQLYIGKGVQVETEAFRNCTNIRELILEDGVKKMAKEALDSYLPNIKKITFNGSVEVLEEQTWNSNLEEVHIKDVGKWCSLSFPTLKTNPLYYAKRLYVNGEEAKEIIIPSRITCINDYAFYNCLSLEKVTLPETVTHIGKQAFRSCSSLSEINLPNSLLEIGEEAFYSCSSLSMIDFPVSVSSIGLQAYSGCTNLKEIYAHWENPISITNKYAFGNISSSCLLYIPILSASKYSSKGWTMAKKEVGILTITANVGGQVIYNENSICNDVQKFQFDPYSTLSITINTDDGYVLKSITINGEDVCSTVVDNTITIEDVDENIELFVEFAYLPSNISVSVTSLGLATYCPAYPVDFSSAEKIWAYKAAVNGNSVRLTKVSTVAAGEGVLLRALSGSAETEELPIATSTTTAATDNEFVGTLTDKQICQIDGDKTNYVLSAETTGVGFYKAKLEADGGTTVPAGKAYLPVITSLLNDVNSFSIGWEDEATGIVSLKAGYDAGAVYNLQGIRIEQPSKGLYIRNGKKIVIK